MQQTMYRNKNRGKVRIDYDVNVYVREEVGEHGDSYWNQDRWYLHVYDYNNGNPEEVSNPYLLTKEESFAMNFLQRNDIDAGLDGWMSMEYLMSNYWDVMSDRVKEYLEGFPKYREDISAKVVYN